MIFRPTHRNLPWYRTVCLLLALAMVVAPMVSVLAELHQSQHIVHSDNHHDNYGSHDEHAGDGRSDNIDENNSLHDLAHASHSCGSSVEAIPSLIHLQLLPITSTLSVSIAPSRYLVLKISHFRPPIIV